MSVVHCLSVVCVVLGGFVWQCSSMVHCLSLLSGWSWSFLCGNAAVWSIVSLCCLGGLSLLCAAM